METLNIIFSNLFVIENKIFTKRYKIIGSINIINDGGRKLYILKLNKKEREFLKKKDLISFLLKINNKVI